MGQLGQIVKLLADLSGVFSVFVVQHEFHQLVVGVQHQGLRYREHICAAAVHAVHLHHIGHSAALLGNGDHGGHRLILKLLYLHFQLIVSKGLLKDL